MNGLVWPTIIEGERIIEDAINRYSNAVWCVSPSQIERLTETSLSPDHIVIVQEANLETLNKAQELIFKSTPPAIIAMGGGKAIDIAKLAAKFENLDDPFQWDDKTGVLQKQRTCPIKLIAIPSTAGSGSEASEIAVITVNGRKIPVHSDIMRPDLVLLDSDLVSNAPSRVLWNGLWDTFVHALESSLSPLSNAYTLPHSLDVFRSSKEMIDQVLHKGMDDFSITTAQWNSIRAGKAQSKTSVGLAHALAHQSEHADQWHGEACARVLAKVLEKNAEKAGTKIAKVAETVGFPAVEHFIDWTKCSVEQSIGAFIPNRYATEEKQQVTLRIMKDPCYRTNPVFWTSMELSTWLEEWFYE